MIMIFYTYYQHVDTLVISQHFELFSTLVNGIHRVPTILHIYTSYNR